MRPRIFRRRKALLWEIDELGAEVVELLRALDASRAETEKWMTRYEAEHYKLVSMHDALARELNKAGEIVGKYSNLYADLSDLIGRVTNP